MPAVSPAAHEANAALVRAFVEEVWNTGDAVAADAFLAPGYRDHAYQPGDATGFKSALAELARAFPDHHTTVLDSVTEGGRIAVRLRLTGTHRGEFRGTAPTGKPIDVQVMRWYRVEEGRIAEHWALFDTLALLRQIGALPTPRPACRT